MVSLLELYDDARGEGIELLVSVYVSVPGRACVCVCMREHKRASAVFLCVHIYAHASVCTCPRA